ncbi:MAG: dihydrodipicolinate synthase family protein [Myxococcota bacterium]
MRTLESWEPPRGLSVPCVTVLDPEGQPLEADQRRLARFLIQSGRGADVVFVMGTTGEWNRLSAPVRQRVSQVVVEEVHKVNGRIVPGGHRPVEAWVGITARSRDETLESLDHALAIGADAAVIAPLAVRDVPDPVRLLTRDVADLLDARDRRIPLVLYDNADIAAGRERRLRTRWVKQWSRLDFVRGIKVSAPPRRLGHYSKAARQFRDLGPFGIYVGNALYVLEMMRPRSGWLGKIVEHWNRFLLHDLLPSGVVSGPANLWPREWQRAWQVACAGDVERMEELRDIFARFRASYRTPWGSRSLASLKRGLLRLGVISSDAVAPGTPPFERAEAEEFDRALERLREDLRQRLPTRWISRSEEADAA